MQEQSCCVANINLLLLSLSRSRQCCRRLSSLLLWSSWLCDVTLLLSIENDLSKSFSFNMLMIRRKARRTGNFCKGFAAQFRYKFYYLQHLSFVEEVSPRRLVLSLFRHWKVLWMNKWTWVAKLQGFNDYKSTTISLLYVETGFLLKHTMCTTIKEICKFDFTKL